MTNAPGLGTRGVMGPFFESMGLMDIFNQGKLMAAQGNLQNPRPFFNEQSGQHIGFEFENPRTGMIEMRDFNGHLITQMPKVTQGRMAMELAASFGAFAIGMTPFLNLIKSAPPKFGPPERTVADAVLEYRKQNPDVEVGEEEDPRAFGEPEEFSGPILQLEQLLRSSLPPLQIAPPSVATKESIINKLIQPETGGDKPPSSVGPPTDVPVGVPLDPKTPLVNPAMRAAALNNINSKKKVDKQNQAFTRFDSLQTRTSTQRIHNMETPLYDYSQQSSRINGLQPGNRPVVI